MLFLQHQLINKLNLKKKIRRFLFVFRYQNQEKVEGKHRDNPNFLFEKIPLIPFIFPNNPDILLLFTGILLKVFKKNF